MKNLIKRTIVALMVVIVLVCSAPFASSIGASEVSGIAITAQAASKKTHLKKTKITLTTGESYTQKLLDKNNKTISASKVKWSTSSKKVATISSSGKIVAKSKGKATLTATYKGTKYKFTVTVKDATLKYKTKTLYLGKSFTQKLEDATGDTISSKNITWKSADKNIATVSSKGKIVGKKAGKVKIYSTYKGKKYTATITVKNPSVKLDEKELTLTNKEPVTLKATVTPSGETIRWKSSNTKVAKVSSNGKVTPIGSGKTTITAYIKYSGNSKTYKATCTVYVNLPGSTYLNPLSGQSGEVIGIRDLVLDEKTTQKIRINVTNIISGDEANALAYSENMYNTKPGNGYEWRFIFIDVDYISSTDGYNHELEATDVLWTDKLFTKKGSSVNVKDTAALGDMYSGQGVFDVSILPGGSASIVFGVLIPENAGDLLLRLTDPDYNYVWVSLTAPSEDVGGSGEIEETDIFANVRTLKNYIRYYGSTNSSGNKFIKTTSSDSGYEFTYGIVYNIAEDYLTFTFICNPSSSSGIKESISFDYKGDSTEELLEAISLYYEYGELLGASKAYALIDIKEFDEDTVLDFSWDSASDSFMVIPEAEESLNSGLQLAFVGWEYLIYSETGLTMSDIGFTSYNN